MPTSRGSILTISLAMAAVAAAGGLAGWLWLRVAPAALAQGQTDAKAASAAAPAAPAPAPASAAARAAGLEAASSPAPPGLEVPGSVEAFEIADLQAKVSGYVQQLNVDIGDRVRAGQVLAVIDVPELHQQLDQAKAEQAGRAAALALAEANEAAARTNLEVARRQLAPYQATATLKEVTYKRLAKLSQDQAASDQDLDDIRAGRDAAVADVEVAKAKIASVQADLDAAKAAIAVAGRQLEVAKADAARIDTLVGYTRIVAPFDGVVTRRLVNRGVLIQAATATATAGPPLLTVQRTDLMRVFADVPEADAARVGPGMPTEVVPYGRDGLTLRGPVTRTASALDPTTRTMRVETDLPNPDGRLMHGMYVRVRYQFPAAGGGATRPATQQARTDP